MIQISVLLIFPMLMAYAAASDLLTMRIPNLLTAILFATFVLVGLISGMSLQALGLNLLCGAMVLVGGFAFFAFGWIGGGDAKLAAGVAAWLGFSGLLEFLVLGSILGGALTIALLMVRRIPLPIRLANTEWIARLHAPKQGVPYGIALAAAALHLYPASEIFLRVMAP